MGALSSNGKRMALSSGGRVRVFEDSGDAWVQLYRDIVGKSSGNFGRTIAMSSDGTKIVGSAGYVRVYEEFLPRNIALYKKASQSSSYSTSRRYAATNAVDGDLDSTILTKYEWEPWWRVDLGGLYSIREVIIFNRKDCCQERLEGAVVNIYQDEYAASHGHDPLWSSSSNEVGVIGGFVPIEHDFVVENHQIKFTLPKGSSGRIVEVKIPGRAEMLSFAHVEVSGIFIVA